MALYDIRKGVLAELERLRDIERRAGAVFASYGMASVAADEPPSIQTLSAHCLDERLWVATDQSGQPIGYLIADIVEQSAHIEQVSVDPDYAGQRIGQQLIDTVAAWAGVRNLSALTLTTFLDIPWNTPYYKRLGFEVVPDSELSPGLQRIRDQEREHGLDQWPRVCMRRAVLPKTGAKTLS